MPPKTQLMDCISAELPLQPEIAVPGCSTAWLVAHLKSLFSILATPSPLRLAICSPVPGCCIPSGPCCCSCCCLLCTH